MEELKRFFTSINFAYNSDFDDSTIEKVMYLKKDNSYNVHISSPKVLNYEIVNDLFESCKKGINGNLPCKITINYQVVTDDDIKNYLNIYIEKLVFEHPSLMGLIGALTYLKEKVAYFDVTSLNEKNNLLDHLEDINNFLQSYCLEPISLNININNDKKEEIKQEMAKSKNAVKTKEENSNIVLGIHQDGDAIEIRNIIGEMKNIILEAYIFGIEALERKGQKATAYIINLKVSDYTDSMLVKIVRFNEEEFNKINKNLKEGKWLRIYGSAEMDNYLKQIVFNAKSIEIISSKDKVIEDKSEEKRVELHLHTKMSQMDGVVDAIKLVKFARSLNHKAVAVTDHNCLQAFPDLYHAVCDINSKIENEEDKFKVIYGSELNIVNNTIDLIYNLKEYSLLDEEYVVFDTETTGFTPFVDQMIEIGAVKIKNGVVTDCFDELINPNRKLPDKYYR